MSMFFECWILHMNVFFNVYVRNCANAHVSKKKEFYWLAVNDFETFYAVLSHLYCQQCNALFFFHFFSVSHIDVFIWLLPLPTKTIFYYMNMWTYSTHMCLFLLSIHIFVKNIVGSDQNNREKTKLKNVQIIQFNHMNVFTFGVKFCVYVKIYEIDNKFTIYYKREMSNRILIYGLISGSLNIPKCIAYM